MLKLISDQNFSGPVLRGIFRRVPDVDILRVLDAGLDRASDPDVLAWAGADAKCLMGNVLNRMALRLLATHRLSSADLPLAKVTHLSWFQSQCKRWRNCPR